MKRSGFKRQMRPKSEPNADRVRAMPAVTPGAFRAPQPVAIAPAAPIAKENPVRSQQYTAVALCESCHRGYNGLHGTKAFWRIRKMDELDALDVTIRRLFDGRERLVGGSF